MEPTFIFIKDRSIKSQSNLDTTLKGWLPNVIHRLPSCGRQLIWSPLSLSTVADVRGVGTNRKIRSSLDPVLLTVRSRFLVRQGLFVK